MNKEFLLKEFRLGFKKVKDRQTGKVYIATGELERKVVRLNIISLSMAFLSIVLILSDVIKSLPLQLAILLVYFVLMTFVSRWLGKRMISEDDLKYAVEKLEIKK
jgi:4-hydroxybenzoate polyprenyltransferase